MFAGTMGHGKDTAADMLADVCWLRGATTLRMAFADPIKEIAVHLLGIPKTVSYGSQEDKLAFQVYGESARHWLQWLGTEVGRDQIHKNIWVHRFAQKAIDSDAQVVIGSDLRFRNEMDHIGQLLLDERRVVLVKIVNPRVPVNLEHRSEGEIYHTPEADFDHVIHNVGDLKDLLHSVETLCSEVLGIIP
jgi:hypothetical protein